MKRLVLAAFVLALAVLPRTGHTINLEEPAQFNRLIQDFVAAVDAGTWAPRDPRSSPGSNPLGHR